MRRKTKRARPAAASPAHGGRLQPQQARRLAASMRDLAARAGRYLPWHTPTDTPEGRNVRCLYIETAWFGLLSGVAATFVSVYALRLGATTAQVGWLTALPALVNVVWLIPAARLIERQRRRLPLMVRTAVLQRVGYLLMALVPTVMARGRVEALIALNMLITLPAAVVNTAITSMIPDLTSPEQRGQVVSVRWLILAVTATLAALLGGWFLDLLPVPLNYQILLATAAALSLFSVRALRRIRVPDAVHARRTLEPKKFSWREVQGSVRSVASQREFLRFTVASFVFHWGLFLPAALWSVLRVRDLGASDAWIGAIAVVIDASTIVGYLLWGKVRARRGDRWLLLVTSVAAALYALATAVVPTIGWMILTSLLGGFAWSGCNLALFNVMLSVCPDERRPTYVALHTAMINVTAFAGPLLGAGLANGIGIRWAFAISGVVRLGGALLFALLMPRGQFKGGRGQT